MSRLQPPAYWLTSAQAEKIKRYLAQGEGKELNTLLWNEAAEVPIVGEPLNAALFGELIPFLGATGNVPFPPVLKKTVKRTRDEDVTFYFQAGVCLILTREEADRALRAIKDFMTTATDEVLSDSECTFLILYVDEPDAVRKGITHLQKAFAIPAEYDATLFVLR